MELGHILALLDRLVIGEDRDNKTTGFQFIYKKMFFFRYMHIFADTVQYK